ncbi:FAD-dependent monooxygenase [Crossiella sp. CA-258035]|uniref:FAD-dependent oxidoreductase n=1 Tax=Crossiella sp. CA-258035 TaxID=2981138 RepID=UPI0024BC2160|nr:FAD-dependent oxidoreductase [Crossiella sp. CA-258035]WHT16545.1 FAD-dependent monooxygenase [Crossiella sp. CA-258035]
MRVVVCGAGIAGLALANQLARLGAEVVLLERASGPRTQGYMIDFFGAGYDAVERMGLLPAIEQVAYLVEEAALFDERGRRRAGVQYRQFARSLGGRLLCVMRPDLERVLREQLPSTVDLRFGAALTGVVDRGDGVLVTLADGTELAADLLVGADGIHSAVRGLVFGEERKFLRYLGFHTAAFQFEAPELHAALRGRFNLTDTMGRQLGLYALRDNRIAAFTVHRAPDPVLPKDVRAALRENYGGLGWLAPTALEKCPPAAEIYYDQVAQVELPSWHRGRVVLVGDAGYAVSLLAGQGASLGIAGAYLLAHQLDRAPTVEDALAAYERRWRPVAEEKQQVARAGARWFLPESPTRLRLRRLALRASRLPLVDRVVGQTLAGKPVTAIAELRS